jgi:hypothetical protein
MQNVPGVTFYRDERRGRVGMLTTLQVKHAMCTLLNAMLRYALSHNSFYYTVKRDMASLPRKS